MGRNGAREGTGRFRKWIFTYHFTAVSDANRNEELLRFVEGELNKSDSLLPDTTYLKIAGEVGEGGRPHLQGYLELACKKSLVGVKKVLEAFNWGGAHVEPAFHPIKAKDYVGNAEFTHANGEGKGGKVLWVWEKGEFSPDNGEGERKGSAWNDALLEIKKLIDANIGQEKEGNRDDIRRLIYNQYWIHTIYCGRAIFEYLDFQLINDHLERITKESETKKGEISHENRMEKSE